MVPVLPYVTASVGLPILSQPFEFSDANLAVFFLPCATEQLNAVLDANINNPSGGHYQYRAMGFGDKVFTLMVMGQMTIAAQRTPTVVYGPERYSELSFFIPCYDHLAWSQRREFRPALFLPLVFPDSFSATATGREMFGFPKQMASYTYPSPAQGFNVEDPGFEARTTAFQTLGSSSAENLVFCSLEEGGGGGEHASKFWSKHGDALMGIIERWALHHVVAADTKEKLGTLTNDLLQRMPAIFLKQFPAIESAQVAESRSITAAPFQLSKFNAGFPYLHGLEPKTFNFNFPKIASLPIVSSLGITTTSASTADNDVVAATGFWVKVDFRLETGTTMAQVIPPRQKIAIMGGGIGGLATAFGITETPDWQRKFDLTVYQLGWRLGGKGASGRNRECADRVEEHGLHIWFGYYKNAFRMIQKCYAEMGRASNLPLATWEQAFKPQNTIAVEEFVNDRWSHWVLPFPPNDGVPGFGGAHLDHPLRLIGEVRRAGDEFLARLSDWLKSTSMSTPPNSDLAARHKELQEHLQKHPGPDFDYESLAAAGQDEQKRQVGLWTGLIAEIEQLIKEFAGLMESVLAPIAEAFAALRRAWMLLRLGIVIARGVLADWVWLEGYKVINKYDFSEWLMKHGASEELANSVIVRSFYDLYLAFPNGKATIVGNGVAIGGNVSAGELLHSYVLVVLNYQGAIMWKMQAGMGDTVMTPLYQVLRARGVKFEFFHNVTELRLTPDKQRIGEIDVDIQVTLKDPKAGYNPLYDVKGLPCWPSTPLYDQIVQGAELRAQHIDLESPWSPWQPVAKKTLRLGEDFDQVVLATSVAGLPDMTAELSAANEAWRNMLTNAWTSQTQAMQLWLNVTLEETGWPAASSVLDAYADPFNTWAVMNQTLDKENWPQNHKPFCVAYFCDNLEDANPIPPYSDHDFPATQYARVMENAKNWLERYTGHLWPWAVGPDRQSLVWAKLVDLDNREGVGRLAGQFFRANISPSERYVCNKANTDQFRLTADGSGFTNLFLAGDWIDNGSLNLGNVESTVISGLQAARAITGRSGDLIEYQGPGSSRKP